MARGRSCAAASWSSCRLSIWRACRRSRRDKQLDELSKRDAARSFDLEKPPLFRMTIIRLDDDQHILLVTLHHIIGDQWSMGVFRKELTALYSAFSKGLPAPLPPLPFQFSDFIHWQKQLIDNGVFDRQVAYWQKRLDGLSPALQFRRAGKRKSSPRFHSARQPIRFDDGLVTQIKSFARAQSCTPFMIFVAGLDILLWSYTGESDIRIGTLVANRGQAGTDGLIGYFVNALVLRTRVLPAMTCVELLKRRSRNLFSEPTLIKTFRSNIWRRCLRRNRSAPACLYTR